MAADTLTRVFSALADPTRRDIVARLAEGDATVGQLAEPYRMTLQAVYKHLRVLEKAGLVVRHRDGRVHRLRIEAKRMQEASEWINQYQVFWEDRLSSLAHYLEQHPEKNHEHHTN